MVLGKALQMKFTPIPPIKKKMSNLMMNNGKSMTKKKITMVKRDFELGLGSQSAIAKRYKMGTTSLWRLAKDNDWVYASKRKEILDKFTEAAFERLNSQRVDSVEQHAIELQAIRGSLDKIENLEEATLIEKRVDILLKCIRGERTTFGLPNEIRQVETKTESVVRVEDMLKTLDAKKQELIEAPDASYSIINEEVENDSFSGQDRADEQDRSSLRRAS